jgi:hypothetical protein
MAVLTWLAVALFVGHHQGEGEVLVTLSATHGIHAGDLPVAAMWVLGMVCCLALLRDAHRDSRRDPPA